MKLSRPQRSVLDGRHEPVSVMLCPGDLASRFLAGLPDRIAMHEKEALAFDAGEELASGRGLHSVPAHVREPLRAQLLDPAGPDATAVGPHAVLDTRREQH